MNGLVAAREILEKCPDTRVLILTAFNADEYVFEALVPTRSTMSVRLHAHKHRLPLTEAMTDRRSDCSGIAVAQHQQGHWSMK